MHHLSVVGQSCAMFLRQHNRPGYFSSMAQPACNDLIDNSRYPIAEQGSALRAAAVARARAGLADDGCAVMRGFFSSAGLAALRGEAIERKHKAHYSASKHCNVYLGDRNPDRADDHPQNIFLPRSNGFVPADNFGAATVSRRLYDWPPLNRFIADCLGKDELFVYEDPISNMIVNVNRPGEQFNWHFDTNEFTITMLLQAAKSGGYFEYVPNLRNADDECYDEVKRVLDGDRGRVKRLELNPGDLQLFLGRFSLHRVTENTGDSDRLLLIMSFAEQPGMIGNPYRVRDLYGKTADVHKDRAVPSDGLLD